MALHYLLCKRLPSRVFETGLQHYDDRPDCAIST